MAEAIVRSGLANVMQAVACFKVSRTGGLLVRRAADVRLFARFAMISPVGPLENACPPPINVA
jgi:hypothetical protein